MPLYSPHFWVKPSGEGKYVVAHNCNGGLGFNTQEEVDEGVYRLIMFAIYEGERKKAREICACLEVKT